MTGAEVVLVPCPKCGAVRGYACVDKNGAPLSTRHQERWDAAKLVQEVADELIGIQEVQVLGSVDGGPVCQGCGKQAWIVDGEEGKFWLLCLLCDAESAPLPSWVRVKK